MAITNVFEAAEMVNRAPTISKASAATFMIEEIVATTVRVGLAILAIFDHTAGYEGLISEGLGVGRKVGVGSAADVGRIAMVGTLTVESSRDMVGTECAGEHVSLYKSFARCLSRPEWLTLNRSLYCLIALRFDDWFFRYGLFPDCHGCWEP